MRKVSVSYKLREGGVVGKSLILKLGVHEKLGSWGRKKLTPPKSLFQTSSPWMNCVAKIKSFVCNKLREWVGVGKALILRRGMNQILGSWGWNKLPPPSLFLPSSPWINWVAIIKGSVSYKLRELGGVGKPMIMKWWMYQRLVSWGWRNFSPSLPALLCCPLGWIYIISPNTRSCVARRKGSKSYELMEGGGIGKASILR